MKKVITPETIRALFSQGGSGTGCSHYLTAAFCPRKASLVKKYPDIEKEYYSPFKMDVGTLLHFLCGELYHMGKFDDVTLPTPSEVWGYEDVVAEAYRVFDAYTLRFSREFWGKPLYAELGLADFGPEALKVLSRIVDPFTARIDMVVELSEQDVARLSQTFGLALPGPGIYCIDFKTKDSLRSGAEQAAQQKLQFLAYPMAYNLVADVVNEPEKIKPGCRGMIVVNMIRYTGKTLHTAKAFPVYFVPLADEWRSRVVRTSLQNCRTLEKTNAPLGVAHGCEQFGKLCAFHPALSGLCTLE